MGEGTGANDFFVNFGSNAVEWSASLPKQLEGAESAILHMQELLTALDAQSKSTISGVNGKIAGTLPPEVLAQLRSAQGTGAYTGGSNSKAEALDHALGSAVDNMTALVTGLRASVEAIGKLPSEITKVVSQVKKDLGDAARADAATIREHGAPVAGGNVRDVTTGRYGSGASAYQTGTAEYAVAGQVSRYVKQVDSAFEKGMALSGRRYPEAGPGSSGFRIRDVSGDQIIQASTDRIIGAIQAQTESLRAALAEGVPSRGPTEPGGTGGSTPVATAPKSGQTSGGLTDARRAEILADPKTQLLIADATLAAMKESKASEEDIAKVTAQRAAIAKQIATAERETLGLTHAEQKALHSKQFAQQRATGPELTAEENRMRTEFRNAIALAGQHNQDSLLDLPKKQLQHISDALSYAGFDTARTGTKEQLAGRIAQSHAAYSQQYSDTVPEQLRPAGSFKAVDKISDSVYALIGDVNGVLVHAREKIDALDKLALNRVGGGGLPFKGTPEYGAGTFGPGVPGSSLTTRGEVINAREVLAGLPDQVVAKTDARFRELIGGAKFNPFDPAHSQGIQGGGETAEANRLVLKSMRDLTLGVDKTAREFYEAGHAVEESKSFVDRARAREEQGLAKPTDAANVEKAWNNILRNQEKLALYTGHQKALFESPEFQAAFAARTGVTHQYDPNTRGLGETGLVGTGVEYQRRVEASRTFTPSLADDVKRGTMEGLLGVRLAPGSKEQISNIPGIRVNRQGVFEPKDLAAASIQDVKDLRSASNQLGAAQRRALISGPGPEGILGGHGPLTQEQTRASDAAFAHLENSATHLANTLQRIAHVAPPIHAFTERPLQDPGNIESEYQRQLVREALQRRANLKFTTTEPEKLTDAQSAVSANQKGLAEATARRVAAEKAATAAATAYAKEQEQLTAELSAAEKAQVAQATRRAEQLAASKEENPSATVDPARRNLGVDRQGRLIHGPVLEDPEAVAKRVREQALGAAGVQVNDRGLTKAQEDFLATKAAAEAAAEAEKRYATAVEHTTAELARIQDYQQKVQQIDAARSQGLLKPDGSKISRKDIVEAFRAAPGADVSGKQVAEILGPARKPKASATDTKISEALIASMTEEERAHAGVATAKKAEETATRALTNAEKDEVGTLKAERAALQKVPHTKGQVGVIEETAADAQKRLSAQRGLVTRYTNAGDEAKASAARQAVQALEVEVATVKSLAAAAQVARERITAINTRLKELGARGAGSGGTGSGVPPTARGGAEPPGPGDEGILARILAELNAIHGTLKSGLTVRGATSGPSNLGLLAAAMDTPAARARALTPPKAETDLLRKPDASQQELEAIAEAQRQRLAAVGNVRQSDIDHAHEQATALKAVVEATHAASQADLQRERAAIELKGALGLLSQATLKEIEELKRLTQAGGTASQVAAQQARVYTSASNDLGRRNIAGADRSFIAGKALEAGGAPAVDSADLASIARTSRASTGFIDVGTAYGQQMGAGVRTGFARVFGGSSGFFDRILHTTGTFLVRNFAAGFVFGLTNELQTALTEAIHTQQTFVRLSSTLESTGKDLGNVRTDLQSVSSAYGVSLNDMYDTAAKLAGVFDTSEQVAGATKTVAQLQAISEGALSADEAVGVLTSIWSAFQDQLKNQGGTEHIADVATALQNLTGTNTEQTLEGVARIAGQAKQMGISLEESATFVAQISKETNTTGATAGEQLSRILAQLQGAAGQSVIKQAFGADIFDRNTVNGAINYGNVLKEVIAGWDGLSKAQQAEVTHAIAGTRQAATFNALMDNGARTLSNLTKATNSQGTAQDRMAALMKTLNGQLAQFRSNFQNLVTELSQTGALNFLGGLLIGVNDVLKTVDHLLSLLNQIGDSSPWVHGIIHFTATLAGAALAAKVLIGAVRGLRESLATSSVANVLSGGITGQDSKIGIATAARKDSLAAQEALDAAMARETAAIEARTGLISQEIAAVEARTAGEARDAELANAIAAADTELLAAIEARTVAEGAAAEAGATSGGLGRKALGFATQPYVIAGAVAAALIVGGAKGQIGRVAEGTTVSGGDLPKQGASADELKAAADAYRAAALKSKQDESQGFFGLGVGPSLTKALTQAIDPGIYGPLHQNQQNLGAISNSLKTASNAMVAIEREDRRQIGNSPIKVPTFTSFDTDYLNKQMQDLTTNGQSAGQQLRELSKTLNGVGTSADQAKGSFLVGGRPTNDLGRWLDATNPGLLKILASNGVDVSSGGPDLKSILGVRRTVTAEGVDAQGNAITTTSHVRNPKSAWTAQNTGEAIDQTMQAILAEAAPPELNTKIKSFHKQLQDLRSRGFTEEAKAYKNIHNELIKFFSADEKSYQTLIGEVSLTRKDTLNLINDIMTYTQTHLGDLPESALGDRTATLRNQVRRIEKAISKHDGQPTSQMIIDLQDARNQLAESQFAELEATRQAAQAADHSKAGLRAAGNKEIHAAIRLAVQSGDADLLVKIIQESGQAGLALAKAAIRAEQAALDAYRKSVGAAAALMGRANINAENALELAHASAPGVAPGLSQNQLDQLGQGVQSTAGTTGSTSDSTIFSGSDVPLAQQDASAQKADAAQLRADHQALIQARLGVAAAYADARGDAVAAARIQVRVAAASIGAARADLAAAKTADESIQARTALLQAQAQMIAAHAAVAEAQSALISSQYDVSIALAEAAGHTVEAVRRRLLQARAALNAALRRSGGKNTAEVNQARAGAIAAEAALRDAKLQDEEDTINFNLQMGRITQSSAIAALQHILKTEQLTKAQRQQLLLQIKGMKDELADSQWNFGDIKLPTPYQMRRYIESRRDQFRKELDSAATGGGHISPGGNTPGTKPGGDTHHTQTTTVYIDGSDIGMVKKLIKEVVGGSVIIRTTQPRRG